MKFSVFIKYFIIFFISLNITQLVKADLASDLLKKAQELAGKKKIVGKKLEAFILSNIITVDFDGKEQTYKFNKDITYEVYEDAKIIGDGTWTIKGLTKSSIKLSGYKDIYFQIYDGKDRISTLSNLKKKKDDQTNRKILKISSPNDFEKQLANLKNKKKAKEKKLAEEKVAKEKKLAEEKAAKEKNLAEEKAAKEKKLAEEKAAKEKRLVEEKLEKEKLEKKLSLIPAQTDLEKAQNFINTVKSFVKQNPDEFDIIEVSEFLISTKPILEGNLDIELKNNWKKYKEFTNSSSKFIKYYNNIETTRTNKDLAKIDQTISSLEQNIKTIKGFLVNNSDSIDFEQWVDDLKKAKKILNNPNSHDELVIENERLSNVVLKETKLAEEKISAKLIIVELKQYLRLNLTTDLAPPILDQIKSLEQAIKKENIEDIISVENISKEFIFKKFEEPRLIAVEEKRIADAKALEEYKKSPAGIKEAEEKRLVKKKRLAEKKRLANFKPVYFECSYRAGTKTIFISWGYDGKTVSFEGFPIKMGKNRQDETFMTILEKKSGKDNFKLTSIYSFLSTEYLVNFNERSSTATMFGSVMRGSCY